MTTPNRDVEHLAKLRDYYARWKSLPSYGRIGQLLGVASLSAVSKCLSRLRDAGFIERTPDDIWIPTRQFFARPLSAFRIPAGQPVEAFDTSEDLCIIDDLLVDKPSTTTVVPVKGDSMIGAGILDGDHAVVERGKEARRGDIVAAIVDGELTLKTLMFNRGRPELHPANPDYSVIHPKGDLQIFGVMVGLARKFRR
jgi:repressor LexA